MKTQLYAFDHKEACTIAYKRLEEGQVIATPTDTVYGLLASLNHPLAIEEIYVIKERPKSKAIPLLIGELCQLEMVAQLSGLGSHTKLLQTLIERWWPGPLTLVLPASPTLPSILTGGQSTVAVRIPDHDQLRQLLKLTGPLAATSANLSGEAETRDAPSVLAQLDGRIPIIFDGGMCAGGMGSTIVDIAPQTPLSPQNGSPRILRPGPLADEIGSLLLSREPSLLDK